MGFFRFSNFGKQANILLPMQFNLEYQALIRLAQSQVVFSCLQSIIEFSPKKIFLLKNSSSEAFLKKIDFPGSVFKHIIE